tara:strand:- start:350 stop:664 length:315 start_codon:yes stop_codon:yes gene_type:complete
VDPESDQPSQLGNRKQKRGGGVSLFLFGENKMLRKDKHPIKYWEENYNQGYIDIEDTVDHFRNEYGNLIVKHKDGRWADVHDWLPCDDGRCIHGVRWWIEEEVK